YTQLLFVLFSGINKVYQIRSLRAFFIGWNFANTPTNILEPKKKAPGCVQPSQSFLIILLLMLVLFRQVG
ncbi:hypothetical protein, partial [Virgibacillus sp. JSM 102003]|uniref:hypothetical protein n=1 Tax=Virgibacillus sp. JSM 102003 TaxID=1562108 RepID=UPI0035C15D26